MESHRLVLERGRRGGEWLLKWDDATLTLEDPDGEMVLEAPISAAHRIVESYELYVEGKVSFALAQGTLTFKKQPAANAAVRRLVETALAGDPKYRTDLKRQSLAMIVLGLVTFVVCGGLFGLYCWFASWAPDPPAGHWTRWFGWLIHLVLLALLGLALAGPGVAYHALRQWMRVRTIGRMAAETASHTEPPAGASPPGNTRG